MGTPIWLKWPLTKKAFCLFVGQLGKENPGTTCVINWAFFYPNTNRRQGCGVWHTWSNFRAGPDRILKRLDHAMISAQSFFSFSKDRYLPIIPLLDVMLSNHYPIYFVINWQIAIQKTIRSQFYLNTSMLTHNSTIGHILRVWNLEPHPHSHIGWIQWWNDAISRTAHFLRIYGRQLVVFRKRSYEATTLALKKASKALTLNPFDVDLQVHIAKIHHYK